ncbi:MAG: hypothetical protein A2156_07540 [Deltaproteobacteria bacterium RBG_16_48_10]|nr:MAG: hypothetical protein A2156_07540 [Deltaproteobacteria bacterium RBG_16_48_10]
MKPFPEELWTQFREILGLKESPLGIYYTNDKPEGITPKTGIHLCMIGLLKKARKNGKTVYFDKSHFGCPGGAYYMGFLELPRPDIEYFLSCGIPGRMEGERYIKTPERAKEFIERVKPRSAPGAYCVFKPIDKFQSDEKPEVVSFFAPSDILSGLYTLTNYVLERTDGVYTPFGSGCSTILTYPLKEAEKEQPCAILGMFDVSARPMVEKDILTLSMPYSMFLRLLGNVSGSFLQTESWKKVLHRIRK